MYEIVRNNDVFSFWRCLLSHNALMFCLLLPCLTKVNSRLTSLQFVPPLQDYNPGRNHVAAHSW